MKLEEKISILLLESSADLYVLKNLEDELKHNAELEREYLIQKSIKKLLCNKLQRKCSIEEKHKELKRRLNLP